LQPAAKLNLFTHFALDSARTKTLLCVPELHNADLGCSILQMHQGDPHESFRDSLVQFAGCWSVG
jgi:hypothetical protein